MKNSLKTLGLIIMLFALVPALSFAKKIDKREVIATWSKYEVSTVAVGQNGTKSLKVWGYGKKIDKAIEQAKKNAVHACLFRGCPGAANARETPAIFKLQGSEQVSIDNFEYFYDFFEENGDYIAFVNVTTEGIPSGQDRRQVKGGYKVCISVQVMYDNLRDKMKRDGILNDSSSRFSY